jgi:hypothetical protein
MMNNEEVLTAFEEYLKAQPSLGNVEVPRALKMLREFAAAIDPVPLADVTLKEITVFERDHRVPAVAVRPVPLSLEHARTRYLKAVQEIRYHEYRIVMTNFADSAYPS